MTETKDFDLRFQKYQQMVESGLKNRLPPENAPPVALHQSMRYCLSAGGKRLRPILLMAVSDSLSSPIDPLPAALAIECLHTYTLIHDDLPAMDNSPLRRGKPSCHCQFGEATAILTGDALLTIAFEILATDYRDHPQIALSLVRDLAIAAGSQELVGGQMEDIENSHTIPSTDILERINRKKTGALFSACTAMGALLGGADESTTEAYRKFGHCLGAAFQVIDDILDFTQTAEQLGKTAGIDALNDKITFVSLEGIEAATTRANHWTDSCRERLRDLPGDPIFLLELIQRMAKRTK